ncbi:MAG: sugar phosphate isomerase/epimerase family protein [Candidatus Brocadiia bacterium]
MGTNTLETRRGTTRRRFLAQAAGAAAAGLAAPALGAEPTAKEDARWAMRLSTSSIHFLHLPVEQACERIATLGFEAVDIWSAHAGCPHLDDVLKRLGPEGLKGLLARTKLDLFAFSVYRGGYPRYAELLGKAGGGVAVRGSTRAAKPAELAARTRQFLDALKPQVELAEKHDSYLAIENHGGALLNTLDSLKAFVDANASPRVGIALAPYHLQGIKASVEKAIAICGDQLFFFYAWQRGRGTRQLPGHGPTDFTPWLAALAEVRYRGCVNPFMHGDLEPGPMAQALARSRDYLRECYAAATGG